MISLVFVTLCAHVAFGSYARPGNFDSYRMGQAYGGYGNGGYGSGGYQDGSFNQPPRWNQPQQNYGQQRGNFGGESGSQLNGGGQFNGNGWGQPNQGSAWNSQPSQGNFGSNAGFQGSGLGAQGDIGVGTSNTNFGQSSGNVGGSAQSPQLGGIANTGFSSDASGTVDTSGQQTFTLAPTQESVGSNFGSSNPTGNSGLENNPTALNNPSIPGKPDQNSDSNIPAPPSRR